MKKSQYIVATIIVILVGGYIFMNSSKENQIKIPNQDPGNTVTIESAKLAEKGWLVIRKDDNPKGPWLRFIFLEAGATTAAHLTLSNDLEPGQIYYGFLHDDNGDQIFDIKQDRAIKENGRIVMDTFTVK